MLIVVVLLMTNFLVIRRWKKIAKRERERERVIKTHVYLQVIDIRCCEYEFFFSLLFYNKITNISERIKYFYYCFTLDQPWKSVDWIPVGIWAPIFTPISFVSQKRDIHKTMKREVMDKGKRKKRESVRVCKSRDMHLLSFF